jgi:hypothetical protein
MVDFKIIKLSFGNQFRRHVPRVRRLYTRYGAYSMIQSSAGRRILPARYPQWGNNRSPCPPENRSICDFGYDKPETLRSKVGNLQMQQKVKARCQCKYSFCYDFSSGLVNICNLFSMCTSYCLYSRFLDLQLMPPAYYTLWRVDEWKKQLMIVSIGCAMNFQVFLSSFSTFLQQALAIAFFQDFHTKIGCIYKLHSIENRLTLKSKSFGNYSLCNDYRCVRFCFVYNLPDFSSNGTASLWQVLPWTLQLLCRQEAEPSIHTCQLWFATLIW